MARPKKPSRAKPIVVEGPNEHDRFSLTGIYQNSLVTGFVAFESLEQKLDRIGETAQSIKEQASATLKAIPDTVVDVGPYRYSKRKESPAWPLSCEASNVLGLLDQLRGALAAGDAPACAEIAILLGEAHSRLFVRQREHLALIGLRQARRNAEIAKGRELPIAELRRRHQAVQDELAKQARRGQRPNRRAAYQAAAGRLDLSERSIRTAFLAIDRG